MFLLYKNFGEVLGKDVIDIAKLILLEEYYNCEGQLDGRPI
jgi:hypothetical protein